jgi:hypothetical protein
MINSRVLADAAHTQARFRQAKPFRNIEIDAGYALTGRDKRELDLCMQDRDGLLKMYQKLLIEKEQRLQDLTKIHDAFLLSRSWKFVMTLQRLRYRLLQSF